jgi:hypothetical protein
MVGGVKRFIIHRVALPTGHWQIAGYRPAVLASR